MSPHSEKPRRVGDRVTPTMDSDAAGNPARTQNQDAQAQKCPYTVGHATAEASQKVTVRMPQHLVDELDDAVESGRFPSRSAGIREAVEQLTSGGQK